MLEVTVHIYLQTNLLKKFGEMIHERIFKILKRHVDFYLQKVFFRNHSEFMMTLKF